MLGFQTTESLHRHAGPPGRDHWGLLEDAVGTQLHHRGHAHQTKGDGPGKKPATQATHDCMPGGYFRNNWKNLKKSGITSAGALHHTTQILIHSNPECCLLLKENLLITDGVILEWVETRMLLLPICQLLVTLYDICVLFPHYKHTWYFKINSAKLKHKFPTWTGDPEEILWFLF